MGDNLISLYLLKQLDRKINIVGTQHTKNIAKLIDYETNITIEAIFEDIPAFYHIREKGIIEALKSIFKFRKYIKQHEINELIFEKKDFRIILLTFGLSKPFAKNTTKHVYLNRKNLIEHLYAKNIFLKPSIKPTKNAKKILINPIAKIQNRNIQKKDLTIIINILKLHLFEISIIDYLEEYNEYKNAVDYYYTHTTLDDVKNLILSTDFFIGTDSFLVHLAYYLEKAFFIIFNFEYFDFLPPNCEIINNYIITPNTNNFSYSLEEKFKSLGLIP